MNAQVDPATIASIWIPAMSGLALHEFRTAANWMPEEFFVGMNLIWRNYPLRHFDVSYSGLTSGGLIHIVGALSGFQVSSHRGNWHKRSSVQSLCAAKVSV